MMILRFAPAVLLALVPVSVLAGMYGQPVVNLDSKTFKTVMATEHAAMVAFVAPWCGHCKNLGPEFTGAASSLSPLIPFYTVDCDDAKNKPLCAEYGIKGFPTIKAFPRAGKGAARDYGGERKKGALVDYAKGLVPDKVKKLRVDDGVVVVLNKFLEEKPQIPHVLLVHPSTPSIPFLWKVLSHRMSGKLHLGFIRDTTSHSVLSALGIYDPKDTTRETIRAIFWQPGFVGRQDVVEYDGELKFNSLLEWLQNQLATVQTMRKKQKPIKVENVPKDAREAEVREAERMVKEGEEELHAHEDASYETVSAANAEYTDTATASKVEDAPDAMPAEGVTDEVPPEVFEVAGSVADPEPEAEVTDGEGNAEQTDRMHEEL